MDRFATPPPTLERRGPLPFGELNAAAVELIRDSGSRKATLDAIEQLDGREITDLVLFAEAYDVAGLRARLKQIAGGSLRAGVQAKALAAEVLQLAPARAVAALTTGR